MDKRAIGRRLSLMFQRRPMNAPNPEGHPNPSGEHSHRGNGESEGGLRSSSSGNVDGGDDFKEDTALDIESVISRKSAAVSLACSMQSESEGASNTEGAKGGMGVEDGDTHERFVDKGSGKSYFVHRVSGDAVWERPVEKRGSIHM